MAIRHSHSAQAGARTGWKHTTHLSCCATTSSPENGVSSFSRLGLKHAKHILPGSCVWPAAPIDQTMQRTNSGSGGRAGNPHQNVRVRGLPLAGGGRRMGDSTLCSYAPYLTAGLYRASMLILLPIAHWRTLTGWSWELRNLHLFPPQFNPVSQKIE